MFSSIAESWTKDTFQTTVSDHLDLVRCVRASYHMAGKKFAYLQKMPWLIVRIFETGVKKQSVSANGLLAHRMSITGTPRHCLHPSQPLQSGIDDLTDDCSKKHLPVCSPQCLVWLHRPWMTRSSSSRMRWRVVWSNLVAPPSSHSWPALCG